jgi:cell division protein FtsB
MNSNTPPHFIKSKAVRGAALVVCVFIGIGIVRSVYTLSQKKGIVTERQQVLRELSTKNGQLQQELKEATSPAFIEREARDNLGLVRQGETVVIMDRTQNSALNDQKTLQELPSWKQWRGLFF